MAVMKVLCWCFQKNPLDESIPRWFYCPDNGAPMKGWYSTAVIPKLGYMDPPGALKLKLGVCEKKIKTMIGQQPDYILKLDYKLM